MAVKNPNYWKDFYDNMTDTSKQDSYVAKTSTIKTNKQANDWYQSVAEQAAEFEWEDENREAANAEMQRRKEERTRRSQERLDAIHAENEERQNAQNTSTTVENALSGNAYVGTDEDGNTKTYSVKGTDYWTKYYGSDKVDTKKNLGVDTIVLGSTAESNLQTANEKAANANDYLKAIQNGEARLDEESPYTESVNDSIALMDKYSEEQTKQQTRMEAAQKVLDDDTATEKQKAQAQKYYDDAKFKYNNAVDHYEGAQRRYTTNVEKYNDWYTEKHNGESAFGYLTNFMSTAVNESEAAASVVDLYQAQTDAVKEAAGNDPELRSDLQTYRDAIAYGASPQATADSIGGERTNAAIDLWESLSEEKQQEILNNQQAYLDRYDQLLELYDNYSNPVWKHTNGMMSDDDYLQVSRDYSNWVDERDDLQQQYDDLYASGPESSGTLGYIYWNNELQGIQDQIDAGDAEYSSLSKDDTAAMQNYVIVRDYNDAADRDEDLDYYVELGKNSSFEPEVNSSVLEHSSSTGLTGKIGTYLRGESLAEHRMSNMTENEKNTFYYLVGKGDTKGAQTYFDSLQADLESRGAAETESKIEEYTKEHPIIGTVANALYEASGAIEGGILNTVDQIITPIATGRTVQGQTGYGTSTQINDYVTQGVTNNLVEKHGWNEGLANFFAGTIVSMANNVANATVWGVTGATHAQSSAVKAAANAGRTAEEIAEVKNAAAAVTKMNEWVSLVMMGTQAGTSAVQQSINQGDSVWKALIYGGVSGAVEVWTEKIGMEKFIEASTGNVNGLFTSLVNSISDSSLAAKFKNGTADKKALRAIATGLMKTFGNKEVQSVFNQSLSEGMEEVLSEVTDYLADIMISAVTGDQSEFQKNYATHMEENGGDSTKAFWSTIWDLTKDVGLSFAGGFVSGIGFGLKNIPAVALNHNAMGHAIVDNGETESYLNKALVAFSEDTDTGKMAKELYDKLKSGEYLPTASDMQKLVVSASQERSVQSAASFNLAQDTTVSESGETSLGNFATDLANGIQVETENDYGAVSTETTTALGVEKANSIALTLNTLLNGGDVSNNTIRKTITRNSSAVAVLNKYLGSNMETASPDELRAAVQQYNKNFEAAASHQEGLAELSRATRDNWAYAIKYSKNADAKTIASRLTEDSQSGARDNVNTESGGISSQATAMAVNGLNGAIVQNSAGTDVNAESVDTSSGEGAPVSGSNQQTQPVAAASGAYHEQGVHTADSSSKVEGKSVAQTVAEEVAKPKSKYGDIGEDAFIHEAHEKVGSKLDASELKAKYAEANETFRKEGSAIIDVGGGKFMQYTATENGEAELRTFDTDTLLKELKKNNPKLKNLTAAQLDATIDSLRGKSVFSLDAIEDQALADMSDVQKNAWTFWKNAFADSSWARDEAAGVPYSETHPNFAAEMVAGRFKFLFKKMGVKDVTVDYTMKKGDPNGYFDDDTHTIVVNGQIADTIRSDYMIDKATGKTIKVRQYYSAVENLKWIIAHELGHQAQGTLVRWGDQSTAASNAVNARTDAIIQAYATAKNVTEEQIAEEVKAIQDRYTKFYESRGRKACSETEARQEFASDCLGQMFLDSGLADRFARTGFQNLVYDAKNAVAEINDALGNIKTKGATQTFKDILDIFKNIGKQQQDMLTKCLNETKDNAGAFESHGDRFSVNDSDVTNIAKTMKNPISNAMLKAKINKQINSEAFKDWFGNSKVVDENGNPKIMFHGTATQGFTTFDINKTNFGLFGQGFYFTDNLDIANSYEEKGSNQENLNPGVYGVYLRIRNPIDMDAEAEDYEIDDVRSAMIGWLYDNDLKKYQTKVRKQFNQDLKDYGGNNPTNENVFRAVVNALQSVAMVDRKTLGSAMIDIYDNAGYDGITHVGGNRHSLSDGTTHRVYIAFRANQVKSVTDNNGEFSLGNNDIRFSVESPASMDDAEVSLTEDVDITSKTATTGIRDLYAAVLKNGSMAAAVREVASIDRAMADRINDDAGSHYIYKPDGTPVAMEDASNTMRFSLGTDPEVSEYLNDWMKKNKLDQQDQDDILEAMDLVRGICEQFRDSGKYAVFTRWSDAVVRTDENGTPLYSVVKPNAEYSMNIDFSLVCKKRRALDHVLNRMIERGTIDKFEFDQQDVVIMNDIIGHNGYHDNGIDIDGFGFEVACGLCFVDAKRYRQAAMADLFVSMYNEYVRSLTDGTGYENMIDSFNYGGNENFRHVDDGIHTLKDSDLNWDKIEQTLADKTIKDGSVPKKICRYLKSNPSARKMITRGDFMSTKGFANVKEDDPGLLALYNSKKGSGGPKSAESDTQFTGQILRGEYIGSKKVSFNAESAYKVGGVRCQSFSDFMARMAFDYCQMFSEMAAKKLPGHSYTKEALYAMMFGKTGMKINMSLVPAVDTEEVDGKVAPAGLRFRKTADGHIQYDSTGNPIYDYAWSWESFGNMYEDDEFYKYCEDKFHIKDTITRKEDYGFELAKRIQESDGYHTNCGTICVAVSPEHLAKLLADPDIKMVIPYHKSGINPTIAKMMKIQAFKDFTATQNTRYTTADGTVKKLETNMKDFPFNARLHQMTLDDSFEDESRAAQEVTQMYVDWCNENGYTPKFAEFCCERDEDGEWQIINDNYYKVLEDFRLYDRDGNYAPQVGIKWSKDVIPTDSDAFGSFNDLLAAGLAQDDKTDKRLQDDTDEMIDQIETALTDFANHKEVLAPDEDEAEANGSASDLDRAREYRDSNRAAYNAWKKEIGKSRVGNKQLVAWYQSQTQQQESGKRLSISAEDVTDEDIDYMVDTNDTASLTELATYRSGVRYSLPVEPDKDYRQVSSDGIVSNMTKAKLEEQIKNGEYVKTYRSMQLINGKLYSPMAGLIEGKLEGGLDPNTLSIDNPDSWEMASANWNIAYRDTVKKNKADTYPKKTKWQLPDGEGYYMTYVNDDYEMYILRDESAPDTEDNRIYKWEFDLDKGNNGVVPARFNPWMHSSNLMLNDQFSEAYKRPNLVTVECIVPKSDVDGSFQMNGRNNKGELVEAMSYSGWQHWKPGGVALELQKRGGTERQLCLSTFIKPIRVVPNSEVAQHYYDNLYDKGISIPENVVTPDLLAELRKLGMNITHSSAVADWIAKNRDKNNEGVNELQKAWKKTSGGNLFDGYMPTDHQELMDFYGYDSEDSVNEATAKYKGWQNNNTRYSVGEMDDAQTENSPAYWTVNEYLLSKSDYARFNEIIGEIHSGNHYERMEDGTYILDFGDKIVYTDGNYESPDISRVVVINDGERSHVDAIKGYLLYNGEARNYRTYRLANQAIIDLYGYESVTVYNSKDYSTIQRQNGRRKGSNVEEYTGRWNSGKNSRFSIDADALSPDQIDNIDPDVKLALNIRNTNAKFVDRILSGEKTIETRSMTAAKQLDLHIGDKVGIVDTGKKGKPLRGYAEITDIIEYPGTAEGIEKFRKDEQITDEDGNIIGGHFVSGGKYDIDERGKVGYVLKTYKVIDRQNWIPTTQNGSNYGSRSVEYDPYADDKDHVRDVLAPYSEAQSISDATAEYKTAEKKAKSAARTASRNRKSDQQLELDRAAYTARRDADEAKLMAQTDEETIDDVMSPITSDSKSWVARDKEYEKRFSLPSEDEITDDSDSGDSPSGWDNMSAEERTRLLFDAIRQSSSKGGGKKISRYVTHTLNNSPTTQRIRDNLQLQELKDIGEYKTEHWAESVEQAVRTLDASADAWISEQARLTKKAQAGETWMPYELDEAMMILSKLQDINYSKHDFEQTIEFAKVIRKQGTSAGKFIAAFAKYNNTAADIAVRSIENLEQQLNDFGKDDTNNEAVHKVQEGIWIDGKTVKNLETQVNDLEGQVKELQKQLNDKSGSIDETPTISDDEINEIVDPDLQDKIKKVRAQRDQKQTEYDETKKKLDADLEELKKLRKERDSLNKKAGNSQKRVEQIRAEIEELTDNLDEIGNEMSRFDDYIGAIKEERDNLRKKLSAKNNEIVRKQKEAVNLQGEIAELQDDLDTVNGEMSRFDDYLNGLRSTKYSIRNRIKAAQDSIKYKLAVEKELSLWIESKSFELEALLIAKNRAAAKNSELLHQRAKLKAQIWNARQRLDALEESIHYLNDLNEKLSARAEVITADVATGTEIWKRLMNKDSALYNYMRALYVNLADADKAIAAAQNHGSMQAIRKVTDADGEFVKQVLSDAEDMFNTIMSSDKKAEVQRHILTYANLIDKATEAYNAAHASDIDQGKAKEDLVDTILNICKYRGFNVPDGVKNRMMKQDFAYVNQFAMASLANISADYRQRSFSEKAASFQYVAQLLNLRTAMRNVFSNAAFYGIESIQNNTSGVLFDMIIGKAANIATKGAVNTRSVGTTWGRGGDQVWGIKNGEAHDRAERAALEVMFDVDTGDEYHDGYDAGYERVNVANDNSRRTYKMAQKKIGVTFEKVMSKLEEINGYSLNVSDEVFKGATYQSVINSFAGFVADGLMTEDQAVELATQELLYRTFQDDTWEGKLLNKIHSILNTGKVRDEHGNIVYEDINGKTTDKDGNPLTAGNSFKAKTEAGAAAFGAGDIVVKYRGVPGALVERAIEYSPLGYVKAFAYLGKYMSTAKAAAKNGDGVDQVNLMDQRRAAMGLSRATTGSGLIALMTWLIMSGIAKRKDDEKDDDVAAQEAAQGMSGTQINMSAIGRVISGEEDALTWQDGDSLWDIGFMDPISSILTMGTLTAQALKDNGYENWKDAGLSDYLYANAEGVLTGVYDSFYDLSMMTFVSDLIDSVKYSWNSDAGVVDGVSSALATIAASAITSFEPSLIRQVAQVADPYYRDSYGSGGWIQNWLGDKVTSAAGHALVDNAQSVYNKIAVNIPGLRYTVPEKTDNFGEDKTYGMNVLERLFNFMVNPGKINKYSTNEVLNEIEAVYKESGVTGLMPGRQTLSKLEVSYTDADGNKQSGIDISYNDYQDYKKKVGDNYSSIVSVLMDTDAYKNATADQKAEMLKNGKNYAEYIATRDYIASNGGVYVDKDFTQTERIMDALGSNDTASDFVNAYQIQRETTDNGKWSIMDSKYGDFESKSEKLISYLDDFNGSDGKLTKTQYIKVYNSLKDTNTTGDFTMSVDYTDENGYRQTAEYTVEMSDAQKTAFANTADKTYQSYAAECINSDEWSGMSIEDRANLLDKSREYAKYLTKQDYFDKQYAGEINPDTGEELKYEDSSWRKTEGIMSVLKTDDNSGFVESQLILKDLNEDGIEAIRRADETGILRDAAEGAVQMRYLDTSERTAEYSDDEKSAIFSVLTNESSTSDKIQALVDGGLTFSDASDIYAMKTYIGNTQDEYSGDNGMNEESRFTMWVNDQNYSTAQKDLIHEQFKYYNMTPQQAQTTALNLASTGMSGDTANQYIQGMNQAADDLGDDASDTEKRNAKLNYVVNSNLTDEQKQALASGISGSSSMYGDLDTGVAMDLLDAASKSGDYSILSMDQPTSISYNGEDIKLDDDGATTYHDSYLSVMNDMNVDWTKTYTTAKGGTGDAAGLYKSIAAGKATYDTLVKEGTTINWDNVSTSSNLYKYYKAEQARQSCGVSYAQYENMYMDIQKIKYETSDGEKNAVSSYIQSQGYTGSTGLKLLQLLYRSDVKSM